MVSGDLCWLMQDNVTKMLSLPQIQSNFSNTIISNLPDVIHNFWGNSYEFENPMLQNALFL